MAVSLVRRKKKYIIHQSGIKTLDCDRQKGDIQRYVQQRLLEWKKGYVIISIIISITIIIINSIIHSDLMVQTLIRHVCCFNDQILALQ